MLPKTTLGVWLAASPAAGGACHNRNNRYNQHSWPNRKIRFSHQIWHAEPLYVCFLSAKSRKSIDLTV